eukprot:6175522-Pleurochrysis_carterae.AAC.5
MTKFWVRSLKDLPFCELSSSPRVRTKLNVPLRPYRSLGRTPSCCVVPAGIRAPPLRCANYRPSASTSFSNPSRLHSSQQPSVFVFVRVPAHLYSLFLSPS